MSMTAHELASHVMEHCPKGCGIFIMLTPDKQVNVSLVDARTRQVTETDFHVEQHRDLEATVLDALSHAQTEVKL